LTKISIFWRQFLFVPKTLISTFKISIFEQNLNLLPNFRPEFWFLTKISLFDQNVALRRKFRISTEIWIFDPDNNFRQKISNFDQNFDFTPIFFKNIFFSAIILNFDLSQIWNQENSKWLSILLYLPFFAIWSNLRRFWDFWDYFRLFFCVDFVFELRFTNIFWSFGWYRFKSKEFENLLPSRIKQRKSSKKYLQLISIFRPKISIFRPKTSIFRPRNFDFLDPKLRFLDPK